MDYLGYLNLVTYKVARPIKQIPYFILGVMFADMETMIDRPLDRIRNLEWYWKIPFNTCLVAMILIWGSMMSDNPKGCMTTYDDRCLLHEYASLHGFLSLRFTLTAASISCIILSLTSEVAQWVLNTVVMQFLAQVSYTLYLVHELVVVWLQRDTYNWMVGDQGVDPESAVTYVFVIYTPLLLVVSWALEVCVDRPAKEFAGEFER